MKKNYRVYLNNQMVGIGVWYADRLSASEETIWFERDGYPLASFDREAVVKVTTGLTLDDLVDLSALPAFC